MYVCMHICMYVCMYVSGSGLLCLAGFHAAREDEGDAGGRAGGPTAGRAGPQGHYEGACLFSSHCSVCM